MIVLFTDFGIGSPYVAQMKSVLMQQAPDIKLLELFSDAPTCNPKASAYLLPAYVNEFPLDTVFLCVVDPGVGNPNRKPVIVRVDGRWFVGPDNGLFNVLASRVTAKQSLKWWDIIWQPDTLSNSFHGRDLFAPVAAKLSMLHATKQMPESKKANADDRIDTSWRKDLNEIIYVDHFGNAMTGLRASKIKQSNQISIKGYELSYARTFSQVKIGQSFWYENANGLVEIAANQDRASDLLSLSPGESFDIR